MTSIIDIAVGVFIGELALSGMAFGINVLRSRAIQKSKAAQLSAFEQLLDQQYAQAEAER